MELLVAADSLFFKTPDNRYWCKTIYGYKFWQRYLAVFEDVAIVSRTAKATYQEVDGYLRVDGANVRVIELPFMRGMKQYIFNYFKFREAAKKAVRDSKCALIRLPSVSAAMVLKYYKRENKPYALEVVADPFEAYASNKLAQKIYTRNLKAAALQANGVSYVTKFYLQSKYPSNANVNGEDNNYFESYFSTINLPETYFMPPRQYCPDKKREFIIIHTANSINSDIKGHDTLIKVLKRLKENNYNVKVIFIGDGSKRQYYENMVIELGLKDYVTFTGLISSPAKVREILISGDLFVFPTKAEGLPRAVIEAMAVGLPCLSTPIAGIPELLDDEFMFNPLDIGGFFNKIVELLNSPEKLEKMSKDNIQKAREYQANVLSDRRYDFYKRLKKLVESD